jgi:uncharacterized membrane protein YhaH (DUF805 family)
MGVYVQVNNGGYQQHSEAVATPLPVTKKSLVWSWVSYGIIVATFIAAFISKSAGNITLMTVFAVLCTLTLTVAAVLYLVRRAVHDAPRSKAVAAGNSVRSVVVWKTLWLVPSLLLFIGMVRSIAGTTPDGIAIGVIGVLTLIPVIPAYIVLGIMRATRKKR